MLHELKITSAYLGDVISGIKTFEIRRDDRDYQIGDYLHLRGFEDDEYTGVYAIKVIRYMLRNCPRYGLKDGYVILGIE